MLPFEQGGLDSLCGIYSLVNADRIVNNTAKEESQILFDSIIHSLEKERLLAPILTEGMLLKHINLILDGVMKDRFTYSKIHYIGKQTPNLQEFWNELHSFTSYEYHAVILGISGIHDHWSVVKEVSPKLIKLQDSASISQLQRSRCTTKYEHGKRSHVLWPAQTYFLANE